MALSWMHISPGLVPAFPLSVENVLFSTFIILLAGGTDILPVIRPFGLDAQCFAQRTPLLQANT